LGKRHEQKPAITRRNVNSAVPEEGIDEGKRISKGVPSRAFDEGAGSIPKKEKATPESRKGECGDHPLFGKEKLARGARSPKAPTPT